MSKRYYWLRLQENFFNSDDIKVIMSQKNGAQYVIFWQKLLLKAITKSNNEIGILRYKENIPYTPEILATVTDTNIDVVRSSLKLFVDLKMIEIMENGDIWVEEANKLVGSESESAQRVRKFREKRKNKELPEPLHCNNNVTRSNVELELEKELEIDIEKESKLLSKNSTTPLVTKKQEQIPYKEIVSYLNEKTGSEFRSTTKATQRLIKSRWKEGFTLDDFKKVIDIKTKEWRGEPDMEQYLRPQTLFGTKFEAYLNEEKKHKKGTAFDKFLKELEEMKHGRR